MLNNSSQGFFKYLYFFENQVVFNKLTDDQALAEVELMSLAHIYQQKLQNHSNLRSDT